MIQTANFVLVVTELVPERFEARNIHFLTKNIPQDPKLNAKWIKNGAVNDSKATPNFVRLEVQPSSIKFTKDNQEQKLQVIVYWDDGSKEDITELTRFRSNDDSIALVDKNGIVKSVGKGGTHIIAFYDNGVQPIPVIRPISDLSLIHI